MGSIPNIITMMRIILAPLVWALVIYYTSSVVTIILWILVSVSDFLDGAIARSYGLRSQFGEYMDPIADKILINGTFIALIIRGYIAGLNVLCVILFIMRDIIIFLARRKKNIPVSGLGKIKTLMQSISIGAIILELNYSYVLLWSACITSTLSMARYLSR